MRVLVELQTGQVSLISGLMAGFSLSVATNVLRYGIRSRMAQIVFAMLLLSSLSFLLALYVDARLLIELAGRESLSPEVIDQVVDIRRIGTSGATFAFTMFIVCIGLLGWLATPILGVISTSVAGSVLVLLCMVWFDIGQLVSQLSA